MERPIRAYRCWHVYAGRGEVWIRSLAMSTKWDGPVLTADEKPAPEDGYGEYFQKHGIYALKCPFHTRREVMETYATNAWGAVDLWGTVVEHEIGYRAEHCMVTRLAINPFGFIMDGVDIFWLRDQLMKRYECDVRFIWYSVRGKMKSEGSLFQSAFGHLLATTLTARPASLQQHLRLAQSDAQSDAQRIINDPLTP